MFIAHQTGVDGADFNYDGLTDFQDFLILARHYGDCV